MLSMGKKWFYFICYKNNNILGKLKNTNFVTKIIVHNSCRKGCSLYEYGRRIDELLTLALIVIKYKCYFIDIYPTVLFSAVENCRRL